MPFEDNAGHVFLHLAFPGRPSGERQRCLYDYCHRLVDRLATDGYSIVRTGEDWARTLLSWCASCDCSR